MFSKIRSLIFKLDPETAHDLAIKALKFNLVSQNKIKSNKPSVNFFLMHFDQTKLNSDAIFRKLANKRIILRKMLQYRIPNSLRLTIGNEEVNNHFIKSIKEICK